MLDVRCAVCAAPHWLDVFTWQPITAFTMSAHCVVPFSIVMLLGCHKVLALSPCTVAVAMANTGSCAPVQEFMDAFYQKRLATKEMRIQEMRKAHALLERQVSASPTHATRPQNPVPTMLNL